jgi:hypothetical protein
MYFASGGSFVAAYCAGNEALFAGPTRAAGIADLSILRWISQKACAAFLFASVGAGFVAMQFEVK